MQRLLFSSKGVYVEYHEDLHIRQMTVANRQCIVAYSSVYLTCWEQDTFSNMVFCPVLTHHRTAIVCC